MSSDGGSLAGEPTTAPGEEERHIGIVTRAVSWVLDAALINLVAIMVGLGTALVLSIFPLGKNLKTPLEAIAGTAYVAWIALYFVVFWSMTGQTPGARIMQIRLVRGANRGRVKPARAVVRWIGMNLAMIPLFAGYIPILFRRRGFPDWLAKTLVLDAPQLSLAEMRRASLRAAHESARQTVAAVPQAPANGPSATPAADAASSPPEAVESAERDPQ
jgi:uncharacterized RDD family membrane protein YckC